MSAYFAARQSEEFKDKPNLLKLGHSIDDALASHDSEVYSFKSETL